MSITESSIQLPGDSDFIVDDVTMIGSIRDFARIVFSSISYPTCKFEEKPLLKHVWSELSVNME